jgi:hypothetical protein
MSDLERRESKEEKKKKPKASGHYNITKQNKTKRN